MAVNNHDIEYITPSKKRNRKTLNCSEDPVTYPSHGSNKKESENDRSRAFFFHGL